MRRVSALFVLSVMAFCSHAVAQSPYAVKYCSNLAASYRKAVAEGKEPVSGIGNAIAGCQTNPGDSITELEAAHKRMQVALPARE